MLPLYVQLLAYYIAKWGIRLLPTVPCIQVWNHFHRRHWLHCFHETLAWQLLIHLLLFFLALCLAYSVLHSLNHGVGFVFWACTHVYTHRHKSYFQLGYKFSHVKCRSAMLPHTGLLWKVYSPFISSQLRILTNSHRIWNQQTLNYRIESDDDIQTRTNDRPSAAENIMRNEISHPFCWCVTNIQSKLCSSRTPNICIHEYIIELYLQIYCTIAGSTNMYSFTLYIFTRNHKY